MGVLSIHICKYKTKLPSDRLVSLVASTKVSSSIPDVCTVNKVSDYLFYQITVPSILSGLQLGVLEKKFNLILNALKNELFLK